jgi:hypothetical protein
MVLVGNPIGDRKRPASDVLGDFERAFADAEPGSTGQLIAIAELYHAFSFDPVASCEMRLDYEPRSSATCAACHSLWVGTKGGEVLRLALTSRSLDLQKDRVEGGVRALSHVHRRRQIIAGLDIGYLLLFDAATLERLGGCHLGRALADLGPAPASDAEEPGLPLRVPLEPWTNLEDSEGTERFAYGITALLELPGGNDDPVDLLVATRTPQLLVVRLEAGSAVVRARHRLPGWSRSLVITGAEGDEAVLCVTRTGELLEWSCRELRDTPRAAAARSVLTDLIPTAVATPLGAHKNNHAVFIGANDGFYIRRERDARPVHVAVTRSAVLSLDTVELPARAGDLTPRVYVALGLEDGRLRVIEQRVLFAWLDGSPTASRDRRSRSKRGSRSSRRLPKEPTTPADAHDFRVAMNSEPLVLAILEVDDPTARFVLIALRDHRLRLFHVRSRDAVLGELTAAWRTLIEAPVISNDDSPITEAQRDALLKKEQDLRIGASRRGEAALRYLLVDRVLPHWAKRRGACDMELVRRACEIARGDDKIPRRGDDKIRRRGDDKVLYGLSMTMGKIARHDANALIEISMACLSAMPQRDAQRWRAFVSYHLKRFHECIADTALCDDALRLQHWDRFVRKYLLLGESFAAKQFRLADLVERNQNARKHFDALLYATQVAQQRYDMRWKVVLTDSDGHPQDILRVDLIHDAALAVTASAEIVFLELEEGKPLSIIDSRPAEQAGQAGQMSGGLRTFERLVPERRSSSIRARAARVAWKSKLVQGPSEMSRDVEKLRIALSWSDPTDTAQQARDSHAPVLHVTVFDLVLSARDGDRGPEVALTASSSAVYLAPSPACAVPSPRDPVRAGVELHGEIEVHGLFGLPSGNGFLAGLDARAAPLALLTLRGEPDSRDARWVMSPLVPAPDAQEAPPTVSTPVRAVTACELDDMRYLGAAGADDGSLRFVVFDRGGQIVATHREPILLVHPVNDVAFSKRDGDPANSRVCYVGTEAGESLCVLVQVDLDARQIVVEQLWRDLHDSPVVIVRPAIQPVGHDGKPLLYDDKVMIIVTQDGHLSIYHARRGSLSDGRLSVQRNYLFEGMRFDRIDLPAGLTSFAIRRLRPGFLASGAHGELRYGELYAPRGSVQYRKTEERLGELYNQVKQDKLFYCDQVTDEQKLAICEVVRIGGDALRNYALRRRLDDATWGRLDATDIDAQLERLLRGLRPEIREERARIKLIVRRVSANVLERSPELILDDCRPGRPRRDLIDDIQRVRAVARRFCRYLLDDAVRAHRGAIRVRMSIMHSLFRANVLSLAALDEQMTGEIQQALRDALTACLRDEKVIVCVEALRAVAVVLRNISILIERAEDEPHQKAVRKHFFPGGLESVKWLTETVIGNFARYRHSQGAPLSTPWSYVTVLVLLIRLFPGDALLLCEQLAGLGLVGALERIVARLRRDRVARLRDRIRDLWLQPPQSRTEFIDLFRNRNDVYRRLASYELGKDDSDRASATDLCLVYHRLALLWEVNDEPGIKGFPGRHDNGELPLRGPIATIVPVLDQFLGIAHAKRGERANAIEKLRRAIQDDLPRVHAVPEAMRKLFERVVDHWQSIFDPKTPTRGETVLGHELGVLLGERGNRVVRAVEHEPQRMVMLLRHLNDASAREAFYRSIRLSRELAHRYPRSFLSVFTLHPELGQAVIERAELASDKDFQDWLMSCDRVAIAHTAAVHLARGLRCLHAEGLIHGDLRAENVFVTRTDDPAEPPSFRLGDLQAVEDLAERSGAASRSFATLMTPSLLRKRVSDQPIWLDLIALTLFIRRLLTDQTLEPDIDQRGLEDAVRKLEERPERVAQVVARMLGETPCHTAADLETALCEPVTIPPAFERQPIAGRALAKYDVFISYSRSDRDPANRLYQELRDRRLVPFMDEKYVSTEDWSAELREAMHQSRVFAILVSRSFNDTSIHAKEARYARELQLPFHVFSVYGARPTAFAHDPLVIGDDVNEMANCIEVGFKPRTNAELM